MTEQSVATPSDLLPPRRRLKRGLIIAASIWLLFMVATAYTSAATLLDRIDSTETMRAASGGMLVGRLPLEMGTFVLVQISLHLAFAGITFLLACATAVLSDTARVKFGRMIVGWFALLAGAALVFNALWYPRTLIGAYYHDALAIQLGPLSLGRWLYFTVFALCALVAICGLARAFAVNNGSQRHRIVGAVSLAGAAIVLLTMATQMRTVSSAGVPGDKPHIILLGIDSLRLENLKRFGGTNGLTPNLDRFLADADIFLDTTTPAARTFSSWMAIMTGRAPPVTGARFNLAERSSIAANPTIADVLRGAGYRTIYSTDEVRFANIDQTYGFDEVVTPRIGASDFIIGTYNELPLASMFINTRLGKWLFPFSYANRGVATMFRPETYIDRVRKDVTFDSPTFFVSHLTAAHWPYYVASTPFTASAYLSEHDRPLYRAGLQTADAMFGELVTVLKEKGALDNAIVVVLSDHGEALGLESDSFFSDTFRVEGLRAPIKMLDFGHGQSVLSKTQYQVLLSFRTFGSSVKYKPQARDLSALATVEDIAPTLLDLLGMRAEALSPTGHSLVPLFASSAGGAVPDWGDRIRFTETDLAVLPAPGGGVDEVATAKQNSVFFEVNPDTGRLNIRRDYAPLALTYKDRAAFTGQRLLAAMPAGPYAHQFIYIDFTAQWGKLLMSRPDGSDPRLVDAGRLWDALHENFPGELKAPADITPEDWERLGAEWEQYVEKTKQARQSGGSPDATKPHQIKGP